jgi:hypothetical protein
MPVSSELVHFRGGLVAAWDVVSKLLDLEARGAAFTLKPDGGFRVVPSSLLTTDDSTFLRAHRNEARRVLELQATNAHLFTDG